VAVALEVAILLVAVAPFVRLAVCRPFLRRLGSVPELAVVGFAALGAYVCVVFAIALVAPALLLPLVIIAVAATLYVTWRARASFGVGRGLPAGQLRIAPVGLWTDPDYFARDRDRFGPIFKSTTLLATPTLCIASLPAAFDLLSSHDAALETPPNRFDRHIPRGFLRSMDADGHDRYAPLLRAAVSNTVVREIEPELRQIARSALNAAVAETPPRAVAVGALARAVVAEMFLRVFFGVSRDDPDARALATLFRDIDPRSAWRLTASRTEYALVEIIDIVTGPRHATSFISNLRSAHPDLLEDPTFVRNLVYMCQTGTADTAGALAWAVWELTTTPGSVQRLRASTDPKWARRALQETLRMEQSEYLTRRVTQPIEWQGYRIPRGWRIRVCVRESHRDPKVFDHADEFDPSRFLEPISHTRYSPFGAPASRSACPGEGLAMTAGRIFLEELIANFDWTTARTAAPEFSGFHWRPSPKFTISLVALST
jgi:cytochrome P450